jgi:hypothetical protein
MPTYHFRNKTTGADFAQFMSIAEKESYLETNTHMEQIITAPTIIGGHGDRVRTDDGFKSVLSKVAEAHPNSNLADKIGKRTGKQIKTRDTVRKHLDK